MDCWCINPDPGTLSGTNSSPGDSHSLSHTHIQRERDRSRGHVWLSFLLSAIPHPWEINRGSWIGARANWALLSLFSYCCQECFVIAAPGSHHGARGRQPVIRWSLWMPQGGELHVIERPCEVEHSGKGIARKGFMYSHVPQRELLDVSCSSPADWGSTRVLLVHKARIITVVRLSVGISCDSSLSAA